ncbi:hypothetical protein BJV78DRAFT_1362710 [Lactifluus subvellereus]|nr:hypothetical protein BJV78DRAFT_1362710 [Lactifluus subvellereus]
MHRLAVLALSLLVLCITAFPSALARETNADRLRRGYPPLPPTRRGTAKRANPSISPLQTSGGVLEVRDQSGTQRLGFVENLSDRSPLLGVSDPGTPQSQHLQATFSGSAHTLVATNAAFPAPFFLGSDFPFVEEPNQPPPGEVLFTNVPSSSGAQVWSFNPTTNELTGKSTSTVALPNPSGGTVPTVFWWDRFENVLSFVTDVPTFSNTAKQTEPPDQQPLVVTFFLVQPN